jgi:hypothetical protein
MTRRVRDETEEHSTKPMAVRTDSITRRRMMWEMSGTHVLIIGVFELNYSRTKLDDGVQRALAHFTKFTLYSSILLLMDVAVKAMGPSGEALTAITVMAATPIAIALVAYDFWNALRALDSDRPRRTC